MRCTFGESSLMTRKDRGRDSQELFTGARRLFSGRGGEHFRQAETTTS